MSNINYVMSETDQENKQPKNTLDFGVLTKYMF